MRKIKNSGKRAFRGRISLKKLPETNEKLTGGTSEPETYVRLAALQDMPERLHNNNHPCHTNNQLDRSYPLHRLKPNYIKANGGHFSYVLQWKIDRNWHLPQLGLQLDKAERETWPEGGEVRYQCTLDLIYATFYLNAPIFWQKRGCKTTLNWLMCCFNGGELLKEKKTLFFPGLT